MLKPPQDAAGFKAIGERNLGRTIEQCEADDVGTIMGAFAIALILDELPPPQSVPPGLVLVRGASCRLATLDLEARSRGLTPERAIAAFALVGDFYVFQHADEPRVCTVVNEGDEFVLRKARQLMEDLLSLAWAALRKEVPPDTDPPDAG